MDLAKLDTLRGDVVSGVCEVEHTPERSVRIGFGYLEEREIRGVWRRQGQLVDRGENTGIGDGPFQVA